ncbi:hypothetical protein (Partial), partial [Seminavis robusta]|eukprot:Sro4141_g353140.1 n/a (40) ;mRNA; r:2-121
MVDPNANIQERFDAINAMEDSVMQASMHVEMARRQRALFN